MVYTCDSGDLGLWKPEQLCVAIECELPLDWLKFTGELPLDWLKFTGTCRPQAKTLFSRK